MNRRLGHRLGWAVLGAISIVGAAVVANLIGIRALGGIAPWLSWLQAHANVFLAWRLGLYGVTAGGWLWMRRRLARREPGTDTHRRLLFAECSALAAIALLETGPLLQRG